MRREQVLDAIEARVEEIFALLVRQEVDWSTPPAKAITLAGPITDLVMEWLAADNVGRIPCSRCGKSVSTPVPKDTLVRAWVECPECLESKEARLDDYGRKRYLGDAVYAHYDGYTLWLTTEDGICTTNRVALEPEVYQALLAYVADLRQVTGAPREPHA